MINRGQPGSGCQGGELGGGPARPTVCWVPYLLDFQATTPRSSGTGRQKPPRLPPIRTTARGVRHPEAQPMVAQYYLPVPPMWLVAGAKGRPFICHLFKEKKLMNKGSLL
jgi:hypothetical protein